MEPEWIESLRYIDLSNTALKTLPDVICDLPNLQTLRLTNCTSLTSLPQRICNLLKLRYLDIRGSGVREMPLQMHKLKSLQVLTDFVVSESGSGLGELAGLSNLLRLTISELQNVTNAKDASNAKLKEKVKLHVLKLQWSSDKDISENEMEVLLENLEPPKCLRELTIESYGGPRFPNWLGNSSYSSLQSVALRHCGNCYSLPPLGLLPFLKRLYIEGFAKVSSIGVEFYGVMGPLQEPFQYLEVLHFQDMLEWKEWNVLDIHFPRLIQLHIIFCSKLVRGLPEQLPSLKKLTIIGCYNLAAPLPIVSDTCKVERDDDETLMKESHSEVLLSHGLTSLEEDQISVHSGPDISSTSSEFDSDIEEIDHGKMTEQSNSEFDSHESSNILMTEAPVLVETSSKKELEEDQQSSFEVLKVSTISQLKSLPPKLHSLKIEGCESLEDLSDDLLGGITTFKELYLISCSSLRSLSYSSTSLTTLYMSNCRRLDIPSSLESTKKLSFLHHLFISSVNLTTLPLNLFSHLKTLSVWDCPKLESFDVIGENRGDLASLESLEIKDCPILESFPEEGLHTPILASITLSNCKNLKKLPNSKNFLKSLESLFLHSCPQIGSFPSGALPSSLVFLSIVDCVKLTPKKEWGLNSLEFLDHFELEGGCIGMESFPEENLLPCNITSLRISSMKSLKKLNYKGFQHLNGLQKLEIHCCNKLKSLPDEGLPYSMNHLCIQECPLLTPRLTEDKWHKVDYIPLVREVKVAEFLPNLAPEHTDLNTPRDCNVDSLANSPMVFSSTLKSIFGSNLSPKNNEHDNKLMESFCIGKPESQQDGGTTADGLKAE